MEHLLSENETAGLILLNFNFEKYWICKEERLDATLKKLNIMGFTTQEYSIVKYKNLYYGFNKYWINQYLCS